MHKIAAALSLVLCAGLAWATEPTGLARKAATVEALRTEIDALRAGRLAWREITWKSCLLDGLRESRAQGKPVLLWVFIDRPADDARC
jgi:hypothetical protein